MVEGTAGSEADLLDAARRGEPRAFERLVAPHRSELLAHGYRMLGSPQDAEDALQEALLGAWRGIDRFAGRSSVRTWLYRICTNACLRTVARRPRRMLSSDLGPSRDDPTALGDIVAEPIWLVPWPDHVIWADDSADPVAAYMRRESLELAFVAALQHLPAAQRATLILREALGFSAAEVAAIMEMTPAAVNSALQRARRAVAERIPPVAQQAELAALGPDGREELVEALILAWERADVAAFVDLLTDDARFSMPPLPAWFDGKAAVRRFVGERMFETPWRIRPIAANAQIALACYMGDRGGGAFRLGTICVLTVQAGRISALTGFLDPALHRPFGLPEIWPDAEGGRTDR